MYKLFVFFSLFITLYAQFEGCTLATDKGGIDMRQQAYKEDYKVVGRGFWDLIINICGGTQFKCKGQSHPSFWVKYDDPNECYRTSNGGDISMELLDKSDPTKGVKISYNNGEKFSQEGKDLKSKTEIRAECDKNAPSEEKPFLDNLEEINGEMVYKLNMRSKFACPDPNTKVPGGRSGGGNSGYAALNPVGVGGILLIVGFAGFILYIVVGMLVMKFKFQATGIEIIPNVYFWKELPFLFKDGILLIWDGIKRITKRGEYQQV